MEKPYILVIEDNVETAKNISMFLEHHDFACKVTHSGHAGVAMMRREPFDLVVLDVMLPDLDGYGVCGQIRSFSEVPIIMLTAKVEDTDLAKGLNQGADDYIRKPYSNKELIARIKAHLRRRGFGKTHLIGPFRINTTAHQIFCDQKALNLTKTEYQLFHAMLNAPNRVFSRLQLQDYCFDRDVDNTDRNVDVHIHNLRKKIMATGRKEHGITSVYGIGYKWLMP